MEKRMKKPVTAIAAPLVAWYKQHERSFPWREDPSPYRVWVSEIMLQQTRIEAALPYFERFMQVLPTVRDLAEAPEDVLLKLWEGLGYYSRVRNLQKAARTIMSEYDGKLPNSYEQLLKLSGIGEYTAGAIASIAFGQRVAAVDGNVLRVMARLTDDPTDVMQPRHRKRMTELVNRLVPADASAFNQGIMELGETICLPNAQPKCAECPLYDYCSVAGLERARELPTRAKPKPRRIENRTVFVVIKDGKVLLHRRPKSGLLAGLWEFPNTVTSALPEEWGITVQNITPLPAAKHVFSHVEWHMQGVLVTARKIELEKDFVLVTKEELAAHALPTAFRVYSEIVLEEDVL